MKVPDFHLFEIRAFSRPVLMRLAVPNPQNLRKVISGAPYSGDGKLDTPCYRVSELKNPKYVASKTFFFEKWSFSTGIP